jgi:hypothetical protein
MGTTKVFLSSIILLLLFLVFYGFGTMPIQPDLWFWTELIYIVEYRAVEVMQSRVDWLVLSEKKFMEMMGMRDFLLSKAVNQLLTSCGVDFTSKKQMLKRALGVARSIILMGIGNAFKFWLS